MTEMNWSILAPEIWLLMAACAVLLIDVFNRDEQRRLTFWLTQGSIAVFALLQLQAHGAGLTVYGLGDMVVSDPMGHLLAFFAALAVMVTLAYARPTLGSRDMLKGEFFTLSLFVLLGISVMCSANHFLVLYLGLEVMSLSLYALAAMRRDHAVATEAAMKYFVLGALASGFLLYGLSMMYGATGTLEIPKVFERIAAGGINKEVLVFGTVFVVAGLAFKLGAAPFHMWVPDVYQGASSGVSAFLAFVPKTAGFLGLMLLLAAVGWRLKSSSRSPRSRRTARVPSRATAEALRAELLAAHPGRRVAVRALYVNDHERVFATFRELDAELGGLDRVIVNAGLGRGASLGTGYFHANRQTAETNFVAALAQCEAAVELFRGRNAGHLVTISSVAGTRGMPRAQTVYAATKAGLTSLSEGLRIDLRRTPIRVTTILPGYIDTDINRGVRNRPFVVDLATGSRALVRAIEREPARAYVPGWPWPLVAFVLRHAPAALLARL